MRHDVFGASLEEWHRSPRWHYEEARMRSKENPKKHIAPNISQSDGGHRRVQRKPADLFGCFKEFTRTSQVAKLIRRYHRTQVIE